jgi:hypothetical protein
LGLECDSTDAPGIDELLERLREVRSSWDWQEEIDPKALSEGVPLSEINHEGIFNRCVLVVAERSKYTRGLETELKALQTKEAEDYSPRIFQHTFGIAGFGSSHCESLRHKGS